MCSITSLATQPTARPLAKMWMGLGNWPSEIAFQSALFAIPVTAKTIGRRHMVGGPRGAGHS
jgi:hypothetical protein